MRILIALFTLNFVSLNTSSISQNLSSVAQMKNDHPLSFAWSLQPLMGICGTVINSFVLYMQYCERQTFIRPVNAMIWYVRANPKKSLQNFFIIINKAFHIYI